MPCRSSSQRRSFASRSARASRSVSAARTTPEPSGGAYGHDDAAHVREALLPDRILDDDRDDLEAPLERVEPLVARRRSEEVRDDEDECAGGKVTLVLGEMTEAALDACPRARRSFGRARASRTRASSVAGASTRSPSASSKYPSRPRAAVALEPMSVTAFRIASGLFSHGQPSGNSDIEGRRSQRTTTRGASSAKCSLTTNSSDPRASESRADAYQSILSTSSPGWYGREPATSEPSPRRMLWSPPNGRPSTRRRGMSGNVAVTARPRGPARPPARARLRAEAPSPRTARGSGRPPRASRSRARRRRSSA